MVYVGIDLGGMSAKSGLFDKDQLVLKERVVTNPQDGFEGVAEKLAYLAESVAVHAGYDFSEVAAIGIGSPGVVDSETGTVAKWGNYHWTNAPLGAEVAKRTKKPVFVTNDANAAALGEAKFGAGEKYSDCVLVTLGTGVGSGIILGGKLFEGFRGAGAEIGHMVIATGGRECGCGRKGCFEQYASASALIRETRLAMMEDPDSLMWEVTGGSLDKADGATAFRAAKFQDKTAQKVVDEYIYYLGEGIVNIASIFRPQAVVLGGGISNEGDALLKPLKKYVDAQLYVGQDYAPMEIVRAVLGNDAGIYGAYAFCLQQTERK